MTSFDYVMLAIVAGSMLVALMRGLVAEILSLTSWLVALWVAKEYAAVAAPFLPLPGEGLQLIGGFVVLFFGCWLATALMRTTLAGVLGATGLSGVDRFFGVIFGLVRGLLLATVLVLVGGLSTLPQQPVWRDAVFAEPLQSVALSLRPWLPQALASRIRYG